MTTSSNRTRDLALTATFAACIAVLGPVPAFSPFGFPVPITLQSLGIMVVGAVLGPRRAAVPVLFFLLLVALGLPLLAGGRGGLGVFAGPSTGYLLGFPVAAAVIGTLVHRRSAPYQLAHGLVAIVIGGIIVLYAIEVPVTAWRAGISLPAVMSGSALFLVGDLAKAVLAAAVHRADPRLLPQRAPVDTSAVPA